MSDLAQNAETSLWVTYLACWEEYERAVEMGIAVWSPGGGFSMSSRPVKCSPGDCTQDHINALRKSTTSVRNITALGLLMAGH